MGRAGKITLLAVATIVLAVGAGVLLVEVADRVDAASDDEAGTPFAAVFDPANAVLDALDQEASASSLAVMGGADLLDESVPDLPETRRATDERIAQLLTSLDHGDGAVAGHYQQAVDTLQGLQTLRDEVDADTRPRNLVNAPYAAQVVDRYREASAPLDEALRTGILRTDDPTLRDGLVLADTSARQNRIVSALVRDLVLANLSGGGLNERAEITAVAAEYADLTTNVEVIKGIDRSPYRAMVERSFPQQLTLDLSAAVEASLAGQPTDVSKVLAIVDVPPDQSYLGLRDQALDEAVRQAARGAGSSPADRSLWLWLVALAVTAALAVGAFIALLVTAAGRRPTPMSPHSLPPPGFPPPPTSP
jgi:hypothetical protein